MQSKPWVLLSLNNSMDTELKFHFSIFLKIYHNQILKKKLMYKYSYLK